MDNVKCYYVIVHYEWNEKNSFIPMFQYDVNNNNNSNNNNSYKSNSKIYNYITNNN